MSILIFPLRSSSNEEDLAARRDGRRGGALRCERAPAAMTTQTLEGGSPDQNIHPTS